MLSMLSLVSSASSGYFALQSYLKDIKSIKILVGINVDQMFAEVQLKRLYQDY
ncbi:MAG: hypothetical protein IPJ03_13680 [Ignavibacteriales bacterium]|nr:hypothetical protein [Ignavibacteriales bacterium]